MIRKMLVIAAAVAMPAAGLAMVAGSGVASAKTVVPPSTGSCAISGGVTFTLPGLSAGGAITNKTTEKTASTLTPTGFCGTALSKVKIVSTTSPCWSTLPVYSKTAPVGGTLESGAPSTCDVNGDTASGDATISATDVKVAIKDQNYYDTTGSFASTGTSNILAAIQAKPIKLVNNGNKGLLNATSAAPVLGGACGATVGFTVTGTSGIVGANNVTVLVCITTDTGPGTSGSFFSDLSSPTALIQTATIAGNSNITYSA